MKSFEEYLTEATSLLTDEDREQLEDICEILRPAGLRVGLADLRLIEVKGTIYFYPTLPEKS